jgi:phosphopantetheinyl transferase
MNIEVLINKNIASNLFKQTLINKYFKIPFNEISINVMPSGKPYINDRQYFNISHDSKYIVGVCDDTDIGIDIMDTFRKVSDIVINKYFKEEIYEIANEIDRIRRWCIRESFIKMKGFTLGDTLHRLRVCIHSTIEIFLDNIKQDCYFYELNFDNHLIIICTIVKKTTVTFQYIS